MEVILSFQIAASEAMRAEKERAVKTAPERYATKPICMGFPQHRMP